MTLLGVVKEPYFHDNDTQGQSNSPYMAKTSSAIEAYIAKDVLPGGQLEAFQNTKRRIWTNTEFCSEFSSHQSGSHPENPQFSFCSS
jgi:hypothetical protein